MIPALWILIQCSLCRNSRWFRGLWLPLCKEHWLWAVPGSLWMFYESASAHIRSLCCDPSHLGILHINSVGFQNIEHLAKWIQSRRRCIKFATKQVPQRSQQTVWGSSLGVIGFGGTTGQPNLYAVDLSSTYPFQDDYPDHGIFGYIIDLMSTADKACLLWVGCQSLPSGPHTNNCKAKQSRSWWQTWASLILVSLLFSSCLSSSSVYLLFEQFESSCGIATRSLETCRVTALLHSSSGDERGPVATPDSNSLAMSCLSSHG